MVWSEGPGFSLVHRLFFLFFTPSASVSPLPDSLSYLVPPLDQLDCDGIPTVGLPAQDNEAKGTPVDDGELKVMERS